MGNGWVVHSYLLNWVCAAKQLLCLILISYSLLSDSLILYLPQFLIYPAPNYNNIIYIVRLRPFRIIYNIYLLHSSWLMQDLLMNVLIIIKSFFSFCVLSSKMLTTIKLYFAVVKGIYFCPLHSLHLCTPVAPRPAILNKQEYSVSLLSELIWIYTVSAQWHQ